MPHNLNHKFEHLYSIISSEDFLNKKSLGGEIPFFISAFEPQLQHEIDKAIIGLKNRLENVGITVLEINLYDFVLEILNQDLEEGEIFELEKEMDKDEFKEALRSILDIHDTLMPAIREKMAAQPAKVCFLTGIGLVFPYIRSHNILNNLQNVTKETPMVAFFPGKYDGLSLNLFGLLKDDNYYRAFNIDEIKS